MKTLTIVFLAFAQMLCEAQGFSQKTNEIQLNFKMGVPTTSALPVIQWISPQPEFTNSTANRIELECMITSTIPIRSAQLVVGDNTTGEEKVAKMLDIKDPKGFSFKQFINLENGSHFVKVKVENTDGAIVTSARMIIVGLDAVALSIDRKDYALLFATDKYDHWDDLVNPVEDSRSIAKELHEKYGFQVELVENPTIELVFEKIREYNQRTYKPQDQLLVFFAGHGSFDETFGEGYVVAKNSLNNDKAKTTYISHNRLRGIVNNIPCEHILLSMDVCFGGTLDPEIARTRRVEEYESTPSEMVARKLSQKTRKYLTSGGKEYVSDGIPGRHSPFAAKMIESLRTYGGTDNVLTLQELIASMEALKQVPRSGSFGDDQKLSDFVFISKR